MNNEDSLLRSLLPLLPQFSPVLWGPGDDVALLDPPPPGSHRILTVDQVISDIHFTHDTPAEFVAQKLVRRNVSDIVAKGGTPEVALLTLALNLPDATLIPWMHDFFRAIGEESRRWNFPICGGDISKLPSFGVCATLSLNGLVARDCVVARHSVSVGDLIYVTGAFGRSFPTQHHLHFVPHIREAHFLSQNHFATAMMDVSDGLLTDLTRMCSIQKVGAILDIDAVPRRDNASVSEALNDGEDYELLFTVSPQLAPVLEAQWRFELPLTSIGKIIAEPVFKDTKNTSLLPKGWCPF